MASNKIIGIDLGTTNSVVGVMEGTKPKVLINQQGGRTTPSVVGFTDKGERLVGQPARHQQVTNPKNTVFSIKRFMGRRHAEVAEEEKQVPYEVTGGPDELVKVRARGKDYTPQEVSAMVLQNLKKTAEDYLGEEVNRAVITVPAYFNDSQRQATKEAGEIAGFIVERIINEPTAAALAYGLDGNKNEKVAVFDFGGGTFDISILDIGDNVFEVLSTNGDTHLGGDDLDEILINYFADEFKRTEGIDLRKDAMALQRLKEAAEKAKCELSTAMEANLNLPFITATADGPKHLTQTITRAKLEQLGSPIFDRLVGPCKQALSDAKLTADDIDEVVLVGGSTRIPKVRQITKEIFGKEPNKSVNPDEVVAIGASVQGAILAGEVEEQMVLLDVTPLSLGVETLGGVMTKLIERNATIPTEKKEIFSTAADSQTEVTIHVLQGEREFSQDNRTLGRFNLTGIPPAQRGVPQIEVIFNIDANGILNVTAKDLGTGKQSKITITASTKLSKEDKEKMIREAEQFSEQDKTKREEAELRNNADSMIYTADRTKKDLADKLKPDQTEKIDKAVNELKDAIAKKDMSLLKQKSEELQKVLQDIGTLIYQQAAAEKAKQEQAQASQPKPNSSSKSNNAEKVVDSEDYKVQ